MQIVSELEASLPCLLCNPHLAPAFSNAGVTYCNQNELNVDDFAAKWEAYCLNIRYVHKLACSTLTFKTFSIKNKQLDIPLTNEEFTKVPLIHAPTCAHIPHTRFHVLHRTTNARSHYHHTWCTM